MDARTMGKLGGSRNTPTKIKASRENGKLGGRPPKISNCSFIYRPKGQALEYAPLAANPYRGCGHCCLYCYVPNILRMSRTEFDSSAIARPNFKAGFLKDAAKYKALGITEQVMLSFTSDPYHPFNTELTQWTIKALQLHGLGACTLTKGGSRALRDLHLFRPNRDAFASTLTSLCDDFSRKWEPGAAIASNRISTLRKFHDAGIFTWVSLEPTLDCDASIAIIKATHEFVDLYKIGRVNYLPMTKTIDWDEYTNRILEVVNRLDVAHYIKHDLQPYLPKGYHNPLRVSQHMA